MVYAKSSSSMQKHNVSTDRQQYTITTTTAAATKVHDRPMTIGMTCTSSTRVSPSVFADVQFTAESVTVQINAKRHPSTFETIMQVKLTLFWFMITAHQQACAHVVCMCCGYELCHPG